MGSMPPVPEDPREEMVTFGDVQIPLRVVQLRDELNAAQARYNEARKELTFDQKWAFTMGRVKTRKSGDACLEG